MPAVLHIIIRHWFRITINTRSKIAKITISRKTTTHRRYITRHFCLILNLMLFNSSLAQKIIFQVSIQDIQLSFHTVWLMIYMIFLSIFSYVERKAVSKKNSALTSPSVQLGSSKFNQCKMGSTDAATMMSSRQHQYSKLPSLKRQPTYKSDHSDPALPENEIKSARPVLEKVGNDYQEAKDRSCD